MKILIISTNVIVCPPPSYAGLENLTYLQAVGLANKGHEVTLIAPEGSSVPDNVSLHKTTLYEDEKQSYSKYWQILPNFDVILDSTWQKWSYILKIEGRLKAPVIGICHCPIDGMYNSKPLEKSCFVGISEDHTQSIREHLKCEARCAYNGVDLNFYRPLNIPRNDRYLFLARMSAIKGPDIAVNVAKSCGVGLDLIGDDKITGEPQLVEHIKKECILNPNLRYIGSQSRTECVSWFNSSYALLHPIQRYREPFGLTIIESQLCGCPVIAWNCGSMPELIKHEETGFLVNSQEEMEELIKSNAIASIDRKRCREWALQFSYENMINRYEELCEEAIATGGW